MPDRPEPKNGVTGVVRSLGAAVLFLVALSPFAKPGHSNMLSYSHSSTLRTVQTIFGVGIFLGYAANANELSDLFEAASTPPP